MFELFDKLILETCKERNFELLEQQSMSRCINSYGLLLLAFKKSQKQIIVYLDLNRNINEIITGDDSRFLDMFTITKVEKSNNCYYSCKTILKKEQDIRILIYILTKIKNGYLRRFRRDGRKYLITSQYQKSLNGEVKDIILKRNLKFGIELELIVPTNISLKDKLKEVGIEINDNVSTHEVCNGWKLVYDGSISTHSNSYEGAELVSPPSFNFEDLEKICKVLNENKIKFNSSCGLHVHHDISDLKRQQILRIYNFYNKYEEVINGLMPTHRNTNNYCRRISNIIDKVNSCDSKNELLVKIAGKGRTGYYNDCRYYTVNLRSYLYYGTIEFRQGYATIDFDIIKNWILFTHKIIERSIKINQNIEYNIDGLTEYEKFEEMMKELEIDKTEINDNLIKRFVKYL